LDAKSFGVGASLQRYKKIRDMNYESQFNYAQDFRKKLETAVQALRDRAKRISELEDSHRTTSNILQAIDRELASRFVFPESVTADAYGHAFREYIEEVVASTRGAQVKSANARISELEAKLAAAGKSPSETLTRRFVQKNREYEELRKQKFGLEKWIKVLEDKLKASEALAESYRSTGLTPRAEYLTQYRRALKLTEIIASIRELVDHSATSTDTEVGN